MTFRKLTLMATGALILSVASIASAQQPALLMTNGNSLGMTSVTEDYLTAPEEGILELASVLTMVGGKVVHSAAPFADIQ